MKKRKIFILVLIVVLIIKISNVNATIINFINHASKDSLSIYRDISNGLLYSKNDIKRLANEHKNIDLDLFINKDNEIFVFHPASECKEQQNWDCQNLTANNVYNTKTEDIVNKLHIIKFSDIVEDIKKANLATIEFKNFIDKGLEPYQKLKKILNHHLSLQEQNKIQFESFNSYGYSSEYIISKLIFPHNFFWKLVSKYDNLLTWINIANKDKNMGLSFEQNSFYYNIDNVRDYVFKKYHNPNICFWTFYSSYNDSLEVSQKSFFSKLLKYKEFNNLQNMYIMGENASFDPSLMYQGTKMIDQKTKKLKKQEKLKLKLYQNFLTDVIKGKNANNEIVYYFKNFQNSKNFELWNKNVNLILKK